MNIRVKPVPLIKRKIGNYFGPSAFQLEFYVNQTISCIVWECKEFCLSGINHGVHFCGLFVSLVLV